MSPPPVPYRRRRAAREIPAPHTPPSALLRLHYAWAACTPEERRCFLALKLTPEERQWLASLEDTP